MKLMRFASVLILLALLTTGCANAALDNSCETLLQGIPSEGVNRPLRVSVPGNMNSFKATSDIAVYVENDSTRPIQVAPDTDLKIYSMSNGVWQPVQNQVNYLSASDLIPAKSDSSLGANTYDVQVNLTPQSVTPMCVTVTGTRDPAGNPTAVGASAVFDLQP